MFNSFCTYLLFADFGKDFLEERKEWTKYNLVVLGDGGVGKSTLTIQFSQNIFVEDYAPTIENCYSKIITIDTERCFLDILDTGGDDELDIPRDAHFRKPQGFIIVYSITNRKSFEIGTKEIYEQILRSKVREKVPIILVGNKNDLEREREVSSGEGRELAKKFSSCPFFETSAKNRVNVDEVFIQIIREIKNDPFYLQDKEFSFRNDSKKKNCSLQ